ncbi:MAG: hypothetical protein JWP09_361 [Candidatus Taylorbacteria bacterium]|nr:hypothetical protein [Candidatus Taylorbacteria bacterium]
MKYKYKIEYTIFVLLLCVAFGWMLDVEYDRLASLQPKTKTAPQTTTTKIRHFIAPATSPTVIPQNPPASPAQNQNTDFNPPAQQNISSSTDEHENRRPTPAPPRRNGRNDSRNRSLFNYEIKL